MKLASSPSSRSWLVALTLVLGLGWVAQGQGQGQGQGPATPRQVPEGLNFANGLYRERRYDLAAEEYEKFLRLPGSPGTKLDLAEAWYGLGNSRLMLGKYQESRQAFEGFIKVAPDHPSVPIARYWVGYSAYALGDLADARQNLEAYLAATIGDRRYVRDAWSHLGEIAARRKDYAGARRAYENALAGNPEGSKPNRARLGLGMTLDAQGDSNAALKVLRDLAARNGPESVDKAWLKVGEIEANAGRWPEAIAAFEALEKASPRSPLVVASRIERAEALGKMGRRDEAEALLGPIASDPSQPLGASAADALGQSLMAGNKPVEALKVFDEALERLPNSPSTSLLRFRSAEAALATGKVDDAMTRFLKLADGDPKAHWADDAQVRAAALAFDAKDHATARRLTESFDQKFPGSPLKADAKLILGRLELAEGRVKPAIETLKALLEQDKPSPSVEQAASYSLGLAYGKDGQAEAAAQAFARLEKTANGAEARFMIAQTDFDAGRYAEAIPNLEKYIADKPNGDVADAALTRLAQAQAALGKLDEADATLARLASSFPKSPNLPITQLRLAEAATLARAFDRSTRLFQLASESTNPTVKARALAGLGWALLQSGKPVQAAEAFGSLVEALPDDPLAPEAAIARGRAFEDAKQPDQAIAAYALAVEKYPKGPQAGSTALALARLQNEAKQPEAASKSFARVVNDYPKTSGEALDVVLDEWAWALVDAGKTSEADTVFARLLQEFPDSLKAADARLNLAESAYAAKDYDRVLELLKPVVAEGSRARPTSIQSALYRVGRTLVERRDWPGASSTFARLVQEFPDASFCREARFWKAEAEFQGGDARAAEADFGALAADPAAPTDPKALVATAKGRRVQCLVQLQRWAEAQSFAKAFRDEEPKSAMLPEVEYARARACQGLAQFDEAREAFDRVIETRRGSELAAKAQLMRGETYFHQQQYREALREFYRVVIQYNAPEWQALALLEAGKVHEKLDQWSEAAETYEKLRTQFPKDKNAEEAGKRLEAARRRIARPPGADDARTR